MVTTTATGNPVLQPPRRSGNADQDLSALWEWITDFYQALAVEQNTLGAVAELMNEVRGSVVLENQAVPQIPAGASAAQTVTVVGAVPGDFAIASFAPHQPGLLVSAGVVATDRVQVVMLNTTGAPIPATLGVLRLQVRAGE